MQLQAKFRGDDADERFNDECKAFSVYDDCTSGLVGENRAADPQRCLACGNLITSSHRWHCKAFGKPHQPKMGASSQNCVSNLPQHDGSFWSFKRGSPVRRQRRSRLLTAGYITHILQGAQPKETSCTTWTKSKTNVPNAECQSVSCCPSGSLTCTAYSPSTS